MPGTSLSPGDIAMKEQSLDLPEAYYLSVRETDKVAIVIKCSNESKAGLEAEEQERLKYCFTVGGSGKASLGR